MRLLLVFAALSLAACSSSEPTASTSDAIADTSADAVGDGGCVVPVEGAACAAGDRVCAGYEGGCCAGYVFTCEGTWKKAGLGCACIEDAGGDTEDAGDAVDAPHDAAEAGPFACGEKTCGDGEYCHEQAAGIPAPDGGMLPNTYTCGSFPSACATTPTCACLTANSPSCAGATCTTDAAGHATLHCMGA